MRKFRSELYEAIYDEFLNDFETGRISEAEFREFEANAFVEEETPQEELKKATVTFSKGEPRTGTLGHGGEENHGVPRRRKKESSRTT